MLIGNFIDGYQTILLLDNNFTKSINPVFINSLLKLDNYIKPNQTKPVFPDYNGTSTPTMVIPTSLSTLVDSITGYTSRGQLAISNSQIETSLTNIVEKLERDNMKVPDWCRFAPFCFNVYCMQPSNALFRIVTEMYIQVVNFQTESNPTIHYEAMSRLITLFKFAIRNDDFEKAIVLDATKIEVSKQWDMWIQTLTEMSCNSKWFFEYAKPFLTQFKHYARGVSLALNNSKVTEFIEKKM